MQRKPSAPRRAVRPQVAYSIAQLSSFTGLTRFAVRGLLDSYGVKLLRSGRKVLVPLTEIEDKSPLLWKNMWRMENLRLTEQEATSTQDGPARRESGAPSPGFLSPAPASGGRSHGS